VVTAMAATPARKERLGCIAEQVPWLRRHRNAESRGVIRGLLRQDDVRLIDRAAAASACGWLGPTPRDG
jgi:hypothetical protein